MNVPRLSRLFSLRATFLSCALFLAPLSTPASLTMKVGKVVMTAMIVRMTHTLDDCGRETLNPVIISDGAYSDHNCAILEGNLLKCWGRNNHGQLAIGNTTGSNDRIGDDPDELGNNMMAVDLGTDIYSLEVTTGGRHTCALLKNMTSNENLIKCWGDNFFGQLGIGNVTGSNDKIGDSPGELGDYMKAVDLGTDVNPLEVSAGQYHTCALLHNTTSDINSIKCWGNNGDGEAGIGNTMGPNGKIGDSPNELGDNMMAVDLGTDLNPLHVSTGRWYACALLRNTTSNETSIKCWGHNGDGQLGIGNNNDIGDEPNELGDDMIAVDLGTGVSPLEISAGRSHTCALIKKYDI